MRSGGIPPHGDGQRIGLLGGSFNPPHDAHRAISLLAMKRLRLDAVWWIISPGNPLKGHPPQPLAARIEAAQRLAGHPRIIVSALEATIGTRFTVDTLRALRTRCPSVRLVWIMGADNLAQFHRWHEWRSIAGLVPLAIVDRGSVGLRALASPAALALARYRVPDANAATLPDCRPPTWTFLTGLKLAVSSTALRRADGGWRNDSAL